MTWCGMEVRVWIGIGSVSRWQFGLNNWAATLVSNCSIRCNLIEDNRSAKDGFFTLQILQQLVLGENIWDCSGSSGRDSDTIDGASIWVLVRIVPSVLIDLFQGIVNHTNNSLILASHSVSYSSPFSDFECVVFTRHESGSYRSSESNRLVRELGELNFNWDTAWVDWRSDLTFGEDWAVDRFIR